MLGGKAFNLVKLIQAGFNVPRGFCITTRAYQEHIGRAGLDHQKAQAATLGSASRSLEAAMEIFRKAILGSPMSQQLQHDIARAYEQLLGPQATVAVRSSAIGEDLESASFAGQQKSYLGVVGLTALLEAVKGCWASLWTSHAATYRRLKSPGSPVSMAVIVQKMVAADVSGVTFTRDPLEPNSGDIVVEATWGLGQILVSGEISPDRFVFRRDGELRLVEKRLGAKTAAIAMELSGGVRKHPLPLSKRVVPALTEEMALSVVRECQKIEDAFRQPQDVEWALADEELYILQARPITGYAAASSTPGEGG